MDGTALLIIDMQVDMALRLASGRDAANPDAVAKIAGLLAGFRARRLPVLHVNHHDADPASPFHPLRESAAPIPEVAPISGEAAFVKAGSSGFQGTGLADHLRAEGVTRLVVCGAVGAFCVSSTIRNAVDLGFAVQLPVDAVLGFGLRDASGARIPAAQVHAVTIATLGADFADLTSAADIVAALAS